MLNLRGKAPRHPVLFTEQSVAQATTAWMKGEAKMIKLFAVFALILLGVACPPLGIFMLVCCVIITLFRAF